MRIFTKHTPLLALGAALALSGCVDDGATPLAPNNPAVGGALFARYVSLGNSITAGFQSGGINDSTQIRSYPVILAQRAGLSTAQIGAPLLRTVTVPGSPNNTPCPRLMVAPLTFGPAVTGTCVRITAPRFTTNLAVPGEKIGDLVTFNPTASNAGLHALIVGGPQTQLEAMKAIDPTLVSVWIGNNDALGAALSGNLGPAAAGADSSLTRLTSFQNSLAAVVEAIDEVIDVAPGHEDAVLIGVVNPITAAPHLQPGAYFYLARDPATNRFNGKLVNANCSPVTALGTPNPLAANMVSFSIISSPLAEINCDPAEQGGLFLLDQNERAVLVARIAAFNSAIQAAAAAHGWIYIDPNAVIAPFLAQRTPAGTGGFNAVRKCQLLPTATTAAEFQTAILLSCPVTGPTAAPGFFGSLISFDGVHPSTAAHVAFANAMAAAINAKHGTALATS
jgi:hypothetical protein